MNLLSVVSDQPDALCYEQHWQLPDEYDCIASVLLEESFSKWTSGETPIILSNLRMYVESTVRRTTCRSTPPKYHRRQARDGASLSMTLSTAKIARWTAMNVASSSSSSSNHRLHHRWTVHTARLSRRRTSLTNLLRKIVKFDWDRWLQVGRLFVYRASSRQQRITCNRLTSVARLRTRR